MHEFHLMAQVVRMVEDVIHRSPHSKPSVVKLKVSVRSHVFEHDEATLQSVFAAAARGTVAEQAVLEILPVTVTVRCTTCGAGGGTDKVPTSCASCGAATLEVDQAPEVVLHEVVVEE